jgi:tRNA nucleotidyltransferase (CCA-adding enzyme)
MQIAQEAAFVLSTLEQAGFSAYLVGGCVRDGLLGRPIHDWDITTSALPEQVQRLFPHTAPTGLRHGTVTVLCGKVPIEVTTFRSEGSYSDHRRPDAVRFCTTLEEDLARRDFTVNALAMDLRGNVIDCADGQADLSRRILRCVGDPTRRFTEDALRMLRAVRFSAQLDFAIEPETMAALRVCAPFAASLSAERVRDEVEKTLLSPQPERVEQLAELGLLCAVGVERVPPLAHLKALPQDALVRWAALADGLPNGTLAAFRLDRHTCRVAEQCAAIVPPDGSDAEWKDLLAQYGVETMRVYAALHGATETLERILSGNDCIFLCDLAVSGGDLPQQGKELGERLAALLHHVHRHPEDNQKERLLAWNENGV